MNKQTKEPKARKQSKPRKFSAKLRFKSHPQGEIDQYGRIFDSSGRFVGCGYATH